MNQNFKDSAKIIAISIEQYPKELAQLLIRNGVKLNLLPSKDELQISLTTALINSESFRDEYANWVVKTFNSYSSADGIDYTFGSVSSLIKEKPLWESNVQGLNYNNSQTTSPVPSDATAPISGSQSGGFFSGFNLNSGLGFVKDTLNTLATIKTASANEALANSIATERANELTQPTIAKSNTTLYVVLSILGISALIGGFYLYNKSKK
jgi:hypothetical protein